MCVGGCYFTEKMLLLNFFSGVTRLMFETHSRGCVVCDTYVGVVVSSQRYIRGG